MLLPIAELEALSGPIDYRHTFLDMRSIQVEPSNFTQAGTTCKPAMGFAFAAGTTDGERVVIDEWWRVMEIAGCGSAVTAILTLTPVPLPNL